MKESKEKIRSLPRKKMVVKRKKMAAKKEKMVTKRTSQMIKKIAVEQREIIRMTFRFSS